MPAAEPLPKNLLNQKATSIALLLFLALLPNPALSQSVSVSVNLNKTVANPGDLLQVYGKALYDNGTAVATNPISIWLDESLWCPIGWWNNSWKYRKPLTIQNQAGNLTDYQVKIEK